MKSRQTSKSKISNKYLKPFPRNNTLKSVALAVALSVQTTLTIGSQLLRCPNCLFLELATFCATPVAIMLYVNMSYLEVHKDTCRLWSIMVVYSGNFVFSSRPGFKGGGALGLGPPDGPQLTFFCLSVIAFLPIFLLSRAQLICN